MSKMHGRTTVVLGKFLEQHMRKQGEYGVYVDGWDDKKVAEALSTSAIPVCLNNVAHLRRDMFGNFPP